MLAVERRLRLLVHCPRSAKLVLGRQLESGNRELRTRDHIVKCSSRVPICQVPRVHFLSRACKRSPCVSYTGPLHARLVYYSRGSGCQWVAGGVSLPVSLTAHPEDAMDKFLFCHSESLPHFLSLAPSGAESHLHLPDLPASAYHDAPLPSPCNAHHGARLSACTAWQDGPSPL
eukprot:712220-Rhodomonas_salina.2